MKRPIVIITIGYIIGIIEGLYLKSSIVLFYILIAIIYFITNCNSKKKRPIVWNYFRYMRYIKLYINKQTIIIFTIASIIGNINIFYKEAQYTKIQEELQKETIIKINGTIASNPIEKEYSTQYKLKIHKSYYINIIVKKTENKLTYGQSIKAIREISNTRNKQKLWRI